MCGFDIAGESFDTWPSLIFGDVPGLFLSGLSVGLHPPGRTCVIVWLCFEPGTWRLASASTRAWSSETYIHTRVSAISESRKGKV